MVNLHKESFIFARSIANDFRRRFGNTNVTTTACLTRDTRIKVETEFYISNVIYSPGEVNFTRKETTTNTMDNADKFFRESHYNIIRVLLGICGLWPFHSEVKRCAIYLVFLLIVGSEFTFQVHAIDVSSCHAILRSICFFTLSNGK